MEEHIQASRPPRSVKFAHYISLILKRVTKKQKCENTKMTCSLDPNFQDPAHPAPLSKPKIPKLPDLPITTGIPSIPRIKKTWRGFIHLVSKWPLRSFLDFDESLVFEDIWIFGQGMKCWCVCVCVCAFVCTLPMPKVSHFKDSTND